RIPRGAGAPRAEDSKRSSAAPPPTHQEAFTCRRAVTRTPGDQGPGRQQVSGMRRCRPRRLPGDRQPEAFPEVPALRPPGIKGSDFQPPLDLLHFVASSYRPLERRLVIQTRKLPCLRAVPLPVVRWRRAESRRRALARATESPPSAARGDDGARCRDTCAGAAECCAGLEDPPRPWAVIGRQPWSREAPLQQIGRDTARRRRI